MCLVGPNCAGVISPGKALLGIMPGHIYQPGHVGVVGRSGTLGYEAASQMKDLGIGISTSVGIGGDPINGTNFIDVLTMFRDDPETEAVVLIGEIGGRGEEDAAEFYAASGSKKPMSAFIAGATAPPGKRMGHAGAIISGSSGTATAKKEALEAKGVRVGESPTETAAIAAEVLRSL